MRLKKSQYEKYKSAIEQQRMKNADFLEHRQAKDRIENVCDLQMAIFKTLEESDILLEQLNSGGKRSPGRLSLDSDNSTIDASKTSNDSSNEKLKKIKSDGSTTIIDDMHTLNHQLHILVYNLITRIDESTHELDVMRDRVKSLEKDRNTQRKVSLPVSNKSSSDSSGKMTDESPTQSERELRRNSVSGEERKIILPDSSELPPLELPEFDYNF